MDSAGGEEIRTSLNSYIGESLRRRNGVTAGEKSKWSAASDEM